MKYYYEIYGTIIQSDFKFSNLIVAEETENYDITVSFSEVRDEITASINKGNRMGYGDSHAWIYLDDVILEINNGEEILIKRDETAPEWKIEAALVAFGLSCVFHQRGGVAFHSSTVVINDAAYILVGQSGAGKSTTAACLMDHGALLMADDVVVVKFDSGFPMAFPAYPRQKLCRDAAVRKKLDVSELQVVNEERDKFGLNVREAFCYEPKSVKAMIVLAPSSETDSVECEKMTDEALNCITQNFFLIPTLRKTGFAQKDIINAIRFMQSVPVYKIVRPINGGDTLEEVYDAIKNI